MVRSLGASKFVRNSNEGYKWSHNSCVFPRIKMKLKGRRFNNIVIIKMNTTRKLNILSLEDFQRCLQKWQEHWDKSISSAGDYFEGNN
jgi:hypothetical protein